MQTGADMVESSMEIPQKIKNGSALWLSDSTTGNLPKDIWNNSQKEYMYAYVHCSIIYNVQDLEAAQVSLSRWVDKKTVVRLHNRILPGINKERNLTLYNSMDGLREHYAKWNTPVRER